MVDKCRCVDPYNCDCVHREPTLEDSNELMAEDNLDFLDEPLEDEKDDN